MEYSVLHKAKPIIGKILVFRNADLPDAGFILTLRTDAKKSRHLTSGTSRLVDQEAWLERYAVRDNEAYFNY